MVKVNDAFPDRTVCVVGLGYVGLTLAAVMTSVGFKVIGVEIRQDVVDMLKQNKSHFLEPGLEEMLTRATEEGSVEWHTVIPDDCKATVYIITVGTPLDANGKVRLDMIEKVTRLIADKGRPGSLVIMRSTVMMGTTSRLVVPILEDAAKGFQVAFCPERTVEGQALRELREIPQVVGAPSLEIVMRASQVFQFLTSTVVRVSDYETAEMIKLVDNSQRDLLFAFANEVAAMCDAVGISANEVIRSGKLGYVRHLVPLPGPVGGPCLSKDPYILEQGLARYGANPKIVISGRKTNETQLTDVAKNLSGWTSRMDGFAARPKITLLGLAFKGQPATDDLRGTTAKPIFEAMKLAYPNAEFCAFDPVVPADQVEAFGVAAVRSLEDAFSGASLVLILNNHMAFRNMAVDRLAARMAAPGLIYDLWHNFAVDELRLPAQIGYASFGSHGRGRFPRMRPASSVHA